MRYHVLAVDFDGTLAGSGRVDASTAEALHRFLATGRHLVMVTGRELPDLLAAFPQIDLFEWVVAENGGLLYHPSTKTERLIAEPPSEKLIHALQRRSVSPLSVGKTIVATWRPHETVVLETIRDLGLDLQIIFNKSAVMVLPAGVNKAFGFAAALKEMGLSAHNAVGIGDAENDLAFLRNCELSAAVRNALSAVKESVDLVTQADHGSGVVELVDLVIADDLSSLDDRLKRHFLPLGTTGDDKEVLLPSYGSNVLICGTSGSGKSTVARRFVEGLMEQSYQFCVIDPEGDYEAFEGAVVLGGPKGLPQAEEILHLLENPGANAVVCLTGMSIPERPPFFLALMSRLLELRNRTGHPHWLILDEAHHLMPAEWLPPAESIPEHLQNTLLITVQPNLLAEGLLERVNTVIAMGSDASHTLETFAIAAKSAPPAVESTSVEQGELLLWMRGKKSPIKVRAYPSKMQGQRHHRKYAEGELSADRSFYFHGPEGKLNLRAQNLISFLQLADGVDDATWEYHLRQGDYTRWFRESIRDETLATTVERIVDQRNVSARESRQLIRTAVEQNYTLPASLPLPVPGAS